MAINIRCGECGSQFSVGDQHAGRRARCPRCAGLIEVPTRELELVDEDEPLADDEDSGWLEGVEAPGRAGGKSGSSGRGSHSGERTPSGAGGSRSGMTPQPGVVLVSFQCHACLATMQAPAELAGRVARCKHCGATLQIPAPVIAQPAQPRVRPSQPSPQAGDPAAGGTTPQRSAGRPAGVPPLPPRRPATGPRIPLPATYHAETDSQPIDAELLEEVAAVAAASSGSVAAMDYDPASAGQTRSLVPRRPGKPRGPLVRDSYRLIRFVALGLGALVLLGGLFVSPASTWRMCYWGASLVNFICLVTVLIVMCYHGRVGLAVACFLGLCVLGIGYLIALHQSIANREEWRTGPLGTIWGCSFCFTLLTFFIGNPFVRPPSKAAIEDYLEAVAPIRQALENVRAADSFGMSQLQMLDPSISHLAMVRQQLGSGFSEANSAVDQGLLGIASEGGKVIAADGGLRIHVARIRQIRGISPADLATLDRLIRVLSAEAGGSSPTQPPEGMVSPLQVAVSPGAAAALGTSPAGVPTGPASGSPTRTVPAGSSVIKLQLEHALLLDMPLLPASRAGFPERPETAELPEWERQATVIAGFTVSGTSGGPELAGQWVIRSRRGTCRGDIWLPSGGRGSITFSSSQIVDDPGPFEFWIEAANEQGTMARVSNVVSVRRGGPPPEATAKMLRDSPKSDSPAPALAPAEPAPSSGDATAALLARVRKVGALEDSALVQELAESRDPRVARAVADLLATTAGRTAAAAALVRMGSWVEPELWTYLAHDDVDVAQAACRVLGQVGTAASLPRLEKLAQDERMDDVAFEAWRAIKNDPRRGK